MQFVAPPKGEATHLFFNSTAYPGADIWEKHFVYIDNVRVAPVDDAC